MRKTRLVIQPKRCLHTIGFLLLYLSCPVIGDWGRIQPDTDMSHRAVAVEREGSRTLVKDPPSYRQRDMSDRFMTYRPSDPWTRALETRQRREIPQTIRGAAETEQRRIESRRESRWLDARNQRLSSERRNDRVDIIRERRIPLRDSNRFSSQRIPEEQTGQESSRRLLLSRSTERVRREVTRNDLDAREHQQDGAAQRRLLKERSFMTSRREISYSQQNAPIRRADTQRRLLLARTDTPSSPVQLIRRDALQRNSIPQRRLLLARSVDSNRRTAEARRTDQETRERSISRNLRRTLIAERQEDIKPRRENSRNRSVERVSSMRDASRRSSQRNENSRADAQVGNVQGRRELASEIVDLQTREASRAMDRTGERIHGRRESIPFTSSTRKERRSERSETRSFRQTVQREVVSFRREVDNRQSRVDEAGSRRSRSMDEGRLVTRRERRAREIRTLSVERNEQMDRNDRMLPRYVRVHAASTRRTPDNQRDRIVEGNDKSSRRESRGESRQDIEMRRSLTANSRRDATHKLQERRESRRDLPNHRESIRASRRTTTPIRREERRVTESIARSTDTLRRADFRSNGRNSVEERRSDRVFRQSGMHRDLHSDRAATRAMDTRRQNDLTQDHALEKIRIERKDNARRVADRNVYRTFSEKASHQEKESFFAAKPYMQSKVEAMFAENADKWTNMKDLAANCVLGAVVLFLTSRNAKSAY